MEVKWNKASITLHSVKPQKIKGYPAKAWTGRQMDL